MNEDSSDKNESHQRQLHEERERRHKAELELERELAKAKGESYKLAGIIKYKFLNVVLVSTLGLLGVGGIGGSFFNYDNIQENTQLSGNNQQVIQDLREDVVRLETLQFNDNHGLKVPELAVCSCIKKDNSSIQKIELCHAKNGVCDPESRTVCEKVLGDEYEC